MKNDFSQQKNTRQHLAFTVQLTDQHQAVCDPITHTNSAGGLYPVTNRGHFDQYNHNPLCSQGECGEQGEPHNEEESSTIILEWTGSLSREVVPGPTHEEDEDCAVNLVMVLGTLNSNSARGTEHLWCHGHI